MKYIFLLNMGGANELGECAEFLKNMFADANILRIPQPWRWLLGRTIAFARAGAMRKNYRQIGGRSRLSQLQRSLCEKMSALANANAASNGGATAGDGVVVDFISAYVPPRAASVLAKYEFTKDDEIVLLPLYAQFSTTTTRSSVQDFCRAWAALGCKAALKIVPPFYQNEGFNELLIARAKAAADADVLVVSAHSLPLSIVRAGDPYERQIREHFALLKARLAGDFAQISLAYQSKLGPVKWLEPALSKELERYAKQRVAVLPLSFCIDCSETDYELRVEYAREHAARGGELLVCECCNDDEGFAKVLLELASKAVALEKFDYINGNLL